MGIKLIYKFMIILTEMVMCHAAGDYWLQLDMIAHTKGKNPYHLFIHCVLYCVPFAVVFGFQPWIWILFLSHIVTDYLKATVDMLSYKGDQLFHYFYIFLFAIWQMLN